MKVIPETSRARTKFGIYLSLQTNNCVMNLNVRSINIEMIVISRFN